MVIFFLFLYFSLVNLNFNPKSGLLTSTGNVSIYLPLATDERAAAIIIPDFQKHRTSGNVLGDVHAPYIMQLLDPERKSH